MSGRGRPQKPLPWEHRGTAATSALAREWCGRRLSRYRFQSSMPQARRCCASGRVLAETRSGSVTARSGSPTIGPGPSRGSSSPMPSHTAGTRCARSSTAAAPRCALTRLQICAAHPRPVPPLEWNTTHSMIPLSALRPRARGASARRRTTRARDPQSAPQASGRAARR
jgi:hypothetical protein